MKIWNIILAFCLLFLGNFSLLAQESTDMVITIPTEDGKVVFADTISLKISSDEAYTIIGKWVGQQLSTGTKKGKVLKNDKANNSISMQMTDYMEVEKKPLSLFYIYLNYVVDIKYGDGRCVVRVSDLNYIESDQIKKDDPYIIKGEDILLRDSYRIAFVTDAATKIKLKTVEHLDKLFKSLHKKIGK